MEKKEKKTKELLDDAMKSCMNKKDETLLVFYTNNEEGVVMLSGNKKDIATCFEHIIREACGEKPSQKAKELLFAMCDAIIKSLEVGDECSKTFAGLLAHVIEKSQKILSEKIKKTQGDIFSRIRNSGIHAPSDFNPFDDNCLDCEDYQDCLLLSMRDKIDALSESKKENEQKSKKRSRRNKR